MSAMLIEEDRYSSQMGDLIRKKRKVKMATMKPVTKSPRPNNLKQYKSKVEQMNKTGYTVLKLSDLVNQFGLPSSKGHKTKDYLELVIKEIEDRDFRFVQFLQLVDILYVIVQAVSHAQKTMNHVNIPPDKFRPEEEIHEHYAVRATPPHPDPVLNQQINESTHTVPDREPVTEAPEELAELKNRDHLKKSMKKNPLPWDKK